MKLKVLGRRAHVSRQSFLAAFFTEEDDLATRSLYHSRRKLKRKKRDTPQKREATLRDRGWKTGQFVTVLLIQLYLEKSVTKKISI